MTTPRTAVRAAAVLGATAALTVAGIGAASATTADSTIDGNTVSVEFALESAEILDTCGAVLAPTSSLPTLTAALANADTAGGFTALLQTLGENEDIHVLKGALGLPFVSVNLLAPSATATATNVPSNVYALVSFCLSDVENPQIDAPILVGDPADAVLGSLSGLTGGDALGTLSSALGGGEAGGVGDLGSMAGMMGGAAGE